MKEKAIKSKDRHLYLLHHDLARLPRQNEFQPETPKPCELLQNNHEGEPVSVAKEWEDFVVGAKNLTNPVIAGCSIKEF